jgi:hypothetical protein
MFFYVGSLVGEGKINPQFPLLYPQTNFRYWRVQWFLSMLQHSIYNRENAIQQNLATTTIIYSRQLTTHINLFYFLGNVSIAIFATDNFPNAFSSFPPPKRLDSTQLLNLIKR